MNFTGIDHFVLAVSDIEEACDFYADLGGEVETFGEDRQAVHFGDQKINLHGPDTNADFVARDPTIGGEDFCLLTEGPIEDVESNLREQGIKILTGPVERAGSVGSMTSVYLRDPDGNLVEIATYDS